MEIIRKARNCIKPRVYKDQDDKREDEQWMKKYRNTLNEEKDILSSEKEHNLKRMEGLRKAEEGLEMRKSRTTGIGFARRSRSISVKRTSDVLSPEKKDSEKLLKHDSTQPLKN